MRTSRDCCAVTVGEEDVFFRSGGRTVDSEALCFLDGARGAFVLVMRRAETPELGKEFDHHEPEV
jgi:hypothetical protein